MKPMKKILLFTLTVFTLGISACAKKQCIECEYGLGGETTRVQRFCGTTTETAEYEATVIEAAAKIDAKTNCIRRNE